MKKEHTLFSYSLSVFGLTQPDKTAQPKELILVQAVQDIDLVLWLVAGLHGLERARNCED